MPKRHHEAPERRSPQRATNDRRQPPRKRQPVEERAPSARPRPAHDDVRANLPPRPDTTKVYGLAAALAVMARRPDQIVRIAHTEAARKPVAPLLREAARRHIAYREVPDDELSRMAESVHHEGVCLLVAEAAPPSLRELAQRAHPRGLLIALDRVGNPHNVGAILRTAAFFGAAGLVLAGARGKRSGLPPAAVRVAEGGAEYVPVARVPELAAALAELRANGLVIVGTDPRAARPLADLSWPERAVLVLGSEDIGLSPDVRAVCDTTVRVVGPGQAAVDSLNVSVAAGVLISTFAASQTRKA
jgi:TrmH RNA methyltransferase